MDRDQNPNPEIEQQRYQNNDIDLLEMFTVLIERWKTLFAFAVVGTLIALYVTSTAPEIYKIDAHISLPLESEVLKINNNSLVKPNSRQLFSRFLDKLKASNNFANFLREKGSSLELYSGAEINEAQLAAKMTQRLSFETLELLKDKSESKVSISLSHPKEKEIVQLINEYLNFTSDEVLLDLKIQSEQLKSSQIDQYERQVALLRESEQQNRLKKIFLIEEKNASELAILEKQIEMFIDEAKASRLLKIAEMEAENQIKISLLEQEYQLVQEKSKRNRETRIAEARDALKIARKLNIKLPVSVIVSRENGEGSTAKSINIVDKNSQYLYLQGTEFLETLIESLSERESDEIYVRMLADITMKIEQLKDDKRLEFLKKQKGDYAISPEIIEARRKMQSVQNDRTLHILKNRKSDDMYIEELPGILAKIRELESNPLQLESAKPVVITKSATTTGRPLSTNNYKVVFAGAILSVILAVIFVLASTFISRQKKSKAL